MEGCVRPATVAGLDNLAPSVAVDGLDRLRYECHG